jgi:glycosyltransferase involved in cell wall biosynthesis
VERARREPRIRLVEIPGLARAVRPWRDLKALLAIRRLLRRERFDVVHTHTSKAGALGRLAVALGGRPGAPHRPKGAPPALPLVVHQPHGHLFYGYYGVLGTALLVLAERLLAPLADVQITLSWRGAEEHLSRRIGRPEQFRVVRSGIDLTPFRRARSGRAERRSRLGYAPDEFVVGALGRLEPIKGMEDLLEGFLKAAATRPRLRLLLGGDGPSRERLLDRARRTPFADRVTIGGSWVDPREVLPALDLFAFPSRNEGMGRALVEAMACGLPVVASAVGGVPEVLEEGGAGLLIPPADPDAVALAIGRLADDQAAAAALARRARARSVAFGAGRMVHALLRVYLEAAP